MIHSIVRSLAALLFAVASLPSFADFPLPIQASARLADGRIVIAGSYGSALAFMRVNADGTRDFDYPYQQIFTYPLQAVTGMVAFADGRMVFSAIGVGNEAVLIGVGADGVLDSTFGSGGFVVDAQTPGLRINAIEPGAGGTILGVGTVPGTSYEPTTAAIVRYSGTGIRDMAYGTAGVATPAGASSEFRAAVAMPDGSVVAAGYTNTYFYRAAALVKILADGSVDATFGNAGLATTDIFDSVHREAYGVGIVGSDLVAVGRSASFQPGYQSALLMARFTPGGALQYAATRDVPQFGQYPSEAIGTAVLAIDADTYVVGGYATSGNFGQSERVVLRYPSGELKMEAQDPNSAGDNASALYAAPSGEVVLLGTRMTGGPADTARRTRYFADNLEYDTDFAQEGFDSTPNPIVIAPIAGGAPSQVFTSAPFRISGVDQPVFATVDGGSYSIGCTEPFTTEPVMLGNGQQLCLRVTTAGATGATTTATITVNGVQGSFSVSTIGAPDTFFTQQPLAQTGRYVVFFYDGDTASGPITGFECRVDADAFASCPMNNHVQVGPLSEGTHTFEVRAINAYGTDPTPALASFTVMPPPETTITSGPGAVSGGTVTFAFTSSLGGSLFLCSLDSPFAYSPCSSPVTYTLAGGTHTFQVYAIGPLDNDPTPATVTWVVDRTPPDTAITSGPGTATYTATSSFSYASVGEAAAAFECQLDGGAWYACPDGSTSVTVTPDVQHLFSVRAIDQWGNADATPATRGWIYYSQPPDTIILSGPIGTVNITNATFTFRETNVPSLFECSLAGPNGPGAFATCFPGNTTYFNLAEGSYVFSGRSRTNDGTYDPTPAQRAFVVDRTAPTTTITSGPNGTVGSASATFEFAANESGVTFSCWLDGVGQGACTSPATYANLGDGSHTFMVNALDLANNSGAAVSRTWQVDRTAPDTAITSAPSGTVAAASASVAFTSEAGALFDCRLDGAAFVSCASPVSYAGLADGTHVFEVRARDAAGNVDPSPASATWTVDTTAPDTSIATGPSGTTASAAAAFTFTATDPSATFECALDGVAFAACASGISYSALANGMHMFEVRARDAVGNVDATPAQRSWSVDTTAPNTTITSGPAVATASTSATFVFTSTEPGTFQCSLDGAQLAPCTSPVTYAALASTSHSFMVDAVDAVGNADASPATWSWIVDNQPPETTITSNPASASNSTSATFTFQASESGSTFQCKLDSAAFVSCASPVAYSGLAAGSHTFQVRGTDALGNLDATPASFSWTVDTTAPNTTITGGPSGNNNPSTAAFTFTSTEPGTFQCKLDAGAFVACASGVSYAGLARGSHAFQVVAIDAAGNADPTPAARTWNVK